LLDNKDISVCKPHIEVNTKRDALIDVTFLEAIEEDLNQDDWIFV
jgi:hypothetical protein